MKEIISCGVHRSMFRWQWAKKSKLLECRCMSHFLVAASSATSPASRATNRGQRANQCDVPGKQLPSLPRNLSRSIWSFTISTYETYGLFDRRDSSRHQTTSHKVIQLLVAGGSAWCTLADDAVHVQVACTCTKLTRVAGVNFDSTATSLTNT